MHLENKSVVNKPAEETYAAMRDRLPELAPYIGNIEKIKRVEKKEPYDGPTEVLNHWFGQVKIPSILKSIAKPEYLQWKDRSTWRDAEKRADFHMESLHAPKLFDLKGSFIFKPAGENKTELTISAELEIYYDRIPGMPRLLAGKVKKYIDDVLRNKVPPAMNRLAGALNAWFQDRD